MSSWFKKEATGVLTPTEEKLDVPEGLWFKCPDCKKVCHTRELKDNYYMCPECNYHVRINSREYFEILFDNNEFTELDPDLSSGDPLHFEDSMPYPQRIVAAQNKSGLKDAVRTAYGKTNGKSLVLACMDFNFIGGSMGSVVGEKIARAIEHALKTQTPMMVISKTGGARMMEAGYSLMQMAKTSARLAQLHEAKILYISLLTDPTTGGVTASYAMLGDFNIAEPGALIGFAGPRVIRETIGKDLPEGFQSAEFLLEHGFIDFIVPRNELKSKISDLLGMLEK